MSKIEWSNHKKTRTAREEQSARYSIRRLAPPRHGAATRRNAVNMAEVIKSIREGGVA